MLGAGGHKRSVRPTVAERDTETLAVAHSDVRALVARGFDQGQRQQIGCDGHQSLVSVDAVADGLNVRDVPIGAGILNQGAKARRLGIEGIQCGDFDLNAQWLRPRVEYGNGLRMAVGVH